MKKNITSRIGMALGILKLQKSLNAAQIIRDTNARRLKAINPVAAE